MRKLFIAAFLILITFNFSYAEGVLLGVAEEPNPWTPSPYISTQPRVKVLFYKAQDKWITLDSKSKQKNLELERVVWTIAFDGKNIGNLVTVDDMKLRHPDCGHCFTTEKIFRIENIDKFPKLGNKEERFSYLGGLTQKPPCGGCKRSKF